ncbi:putative partitioning protein ParA ATPase (plasmid) [Zymomonas mobilis subsp. mobilis ZM4 = ATCC 31821]|mgnify:CR=1 FL=1|uniref:Stability/partitioning determinant n=3 Tax=Zymomonas mobilis TaxID=542 RepID=D3G2F6_ZYMMO|nr:ParA family protein [Zymomonas mobilis]AAF23806.1 partitioning protein [Zymomonas mobilis subsp. mobilis ZM4 = ATCC 31821]AAL36144.1 unknown [Zymomonas mobilis subsp. mobilis ZM4 = ATCC 31821]ACV76408.1 ATPase involved in chromosome partitioning-like protein [Zymomonas mobilis subsp. mobilis NCIMB 11163]ADC33906.1 stability/partitioning determinant [Zymomonas mobilis subsp. mobilis ZM4 = ATCC 31821]AEH63607.1 ATPase involved in chromosome partitioning-like protein [Zymomonas mobilis subsp. 
MPTVVVASPKGGAGKSTTAVLLGTGLAHAGAEVVMVDCDPNRSLTIWSKRGTMPQRMRVLSDVTESEIVKTIKNHDNDGKIIIVDLEGIASRLVSRAISQADLVLIPMRATTLDATIGARALQLIEEEEEALDRSIPYALVFTMTKAVKSKQHSGIEKSFREQGVDLIEPPLMERAAFSALFEFGGDLYSMPEQGNMEKAIENASLFVQAVYQRLTGDAQ